MKFLPIFGALLFLVGLFSINSASLIDGANFTLTVADPPNTTTGRSFYGLSDCIKDKAEAHAYCGSYYGYLIKLDLNPTISFSSEFNTEPKAPVRSIAFYEGTSSSRVFYNDFGTIKYIDVASFGNSPKSTPIAVDKSALGSSYSVGYKNHVIVDASNKMIYVGGEGKIFKIINIDSTPVFSSDAIDLVDSGDDSGDLILANGTLYVAVKDAPGKVSRIASPESATAVTSKTVTFTTSDQMFDSNRCLHHVGNFIYAVTPDYGIVVKMSIGSTDDDFALVSSTSPSSSIYTQFALLTPDSAFLIVGGYEDTKIHFFDIAAMEYQTNSLGGPEQIVGGVLTSSGRVILSDQHTSILYNYEIDDSTSSPGDPSSAGASSALSVFFLFALVLLVA